MNFKPRWLELWEELTETIVVSSPKSKVKGSTESKDLQNAPYEKETEGNK